MAVVAVLASSCIKETFPTDKATTQQLAGSPSALAAAVNGLPAQLVQGYLIYGSQTYEFDMAYPGIMLALDQASGTIVDNSEEGSGYDWYSYWSGFGSFTIGPKTARAYVPWLTFYMFIKSANDVIGAVPEDETDALKLQYKGMAYAVRAWQYLNLTRVYEWKAPTDPNVDAKYKPENDIKGLTVPIVTEATTLEDAKNNPRVPEDDMYKFIFEDLDKAEAYMANYSEKNPVLPSLPVVYGLQARANLERGSSLEEKAAGSGSEYFRKAAEYAQKAIDASGCTPLTQAEWEDPVNGFNSAVSNNAWMWCLRYSAETTSNLCTYVGHLSVEPTWTAYAFAPCRGLLCETYDRISNTDWRKHSWIDPKGKDFYKYKTNRDVFDPDDKPAMPYTSLKFRPGKGNCDTYKEGGVTDVPLMRVEEMYFIKAEAEAMSDLAQGKATLTSFMQSYRNPNYSCNASTLRAFQEEIFFQKTIEFWGEGIIFFDAKRLAMGQYNGFTGTNACSDQHYNCTGVCPWWNWVIPQSEIEGNPALDGYNNPDPTGSVKKWVDK